VSRKLQRQLRDLREDYATAQQKETEANAKKNELVIQRAILNFTPIGGTWPPGVKFVA
jgi:hypothetical protein